MSKPLIDENRLREMRASGMTVMEIAEEFDATEGQIRMICSDIGIQSALGNSKMTWDQAARRASEMLAAKLKRVHPERCGEARAA